MRLAHKSRRSVTWLIDNGDGMNKYEHMATYAYTYDATHTIKYCFKQYEFMILVQMINPYYVA